MCLPVRFKGCGEYQNVELQQVNKNYYYIHTVKEYITISFMTVIPYPDLQLRLHHHLQYHHCRLLHFRLPRHPLWRGSHPKPTVFSKTKSVECAVLILLSPHQRERKPVVPTYRHIEHTFNVLYIYNNLGINKCLC